MKSFAICLVAALSWPGWSADEPKTPGDRDAKAQSAPVWGPFMEHFHSCARENKWKKCEPVQYATYTDVGKKSCLTVGRALNLWAFQCGGKIYKAKDGGVFEDMMKCIGTRMTVKYRENTVDPIKAYRDFSLISLGCTVDGMPLSY